MKHYARTLNEGRALHFGFEIAFSVDEPEGDDGAILGIMRELKPWLHNCGASQVRITAQFSKHEATEKLTKIFVEDFDITLQAPPADRLLLLPLQMANYRLVHHLETFS